MRLTRLAMLVLLPLLCALSLTGCASAPKVPPMVAAEPAIAYKPTPVPDEALPCPARPEPPGEDAADEELATFIAKYDYALSTCRASVERAKTILRNRAR